MKNEQKYEIMKVIATDVNGNSKYPDSLRTIVLLNVLKLEMTLGKCEEAWYMNYLQFHRDGPMYINKKPNYAKKLSVFDELLIEDVNENSLQDYYISTILFRNNNLEPFQPYIELNFLKNIQAKVLVLKGEPIENIEKDYKPINLLTSIELEP